MSKDSFAFRILGKTELGWRTNGEDCERECKPVGPVERKSTKERFKENSTNLVMVRQGDCKKTPEALLMYSWVQ